MWKVMLGKEGLGLEQISTMRHQTDDLIVVYGENDEHTIAAALLCGADRYIPKGMEKRIEVAYINALLRRC